MRRTIQWELMAAAAAALLLTVALLGLTVPGSVERRLRAEQQTGLLAEAELAARLATGLLARDHPPSSQPQLEQLAKELARMLDAETVIVDRQGILRAGTVSR